MRSVEVAVPGHPYPVLIGAGALARLESFLTGRVLVVVPTMAWQGANRIDDNAAEFTTDPYGGKNSVVVIGAEPLVVGYGSHPKKAATALHRVSFQYKPAGRPRLVTRPSSTGLLLVVKTMGIAVVAPFATIFAGVLVAAITLT